MRGVEVLAVDTDDHACAPVITIGGTVLDVGSSVVTYTKAETATITAISPRHGSVTGGDVITFTGTGFNSADEANYSITFDDVDCPIVAASMSATSVQCTTGAKTGLPQIDPTLVFKHST